MNGVALAARLALVGVFALAGAAKLRDRDGTRFTLEDFGLPDRLAAPGALLLPVAELGVAGLLLFDPTAVAGAIGALVLLGAFMVGISVNLAQGRRPDCNCFGQLQSKPVGPGTLARNATLAVLGGLVLATGRTDAASTALDDVGSLDTATALAAGALVLSALTLGLVCWIGLHLLRQQGRALLRLDALDGGGEPTGEPRPRGLPVGAPAPAFDVATTNGDRVALGQLLADGGAVALAFVDPDCRPCRALLPDLAKRNGRVAVVISGADAGAAGALAAEHDLSSALLDLDGSLAASYDVEGTPMAVAIGSDGLIRSELATGPDAVRELLDGLDSPAGDGFALPITSVGGEPPLGEPVPDVELEDLDGAAVTLHAAASGAPHLIVFWNPTCGFCDSMLEEVRALERRDDLPPLLFVTTGEAQVNRDQGLRSRMLLDPGFAGTGEALGVAGTPSALRLDADGRIVSRLAVGVDQVLMLAGARGGVTERSGAGGPAG
jgi:peroxiredoxin/thiol-disulfide isomerase/thioredoxin